MCVRDVVPGARDHKNIRRTMKFRKFAVWIFDCIQGTDGPGLELRGGHPRCLAAAIVTATANLLRAGSKTEWGALELDKEALKAYAGASTVKKKLTLVEAVIRINLTAGRKAT